MKTLPPPDAYVYKAFSAWGLAFFNFLFLCTFARSLSVIDAFYRMFDSRPDFAGSLRLSGYLAANIVTFDFLDACGARGWLEQRSWIPKQIDSGIIGAGLWAYKMLVDVTIVGSLGWLAKQRWQARRTVTAARKVGGERAIVDELNINNIPVLIATLDARVDSDVVFQRRILKTLAECDCEQVRVALLHVLHATNDAPTKTMIEEYFSKHHDARFERRMRHLERPVRRPAPRKKWVWTSRRSKKRPS